MTSRTRFRWRHALAILSSMCVLVAACGSEAGESAETGEVTTTTSIATTTVGDAISDGVEDDTGSDSGTDGVSLGDVTVRTEEGPGWELVSVEPGFGHSHEVAFMSSERALDRGGDARWFDTRPRPDFGTEVVIVLAPAVSGSCPALIFEGLVITDPHVFGLFEKGPPPAGSTACTSDANPVAFVFVVALESLPETFALSVEEEVRCGGCEQAQIMVDLADLAALELALWGVGTLNIVIDGSPPAPGTAHVFRWAPDAALLLPASEFTNLPRWIQSFEGGDARTIEGFVVECGADGCPEECDDQSCATLEPLGNVCSYEHRPENFRDDTLTITWEGDNCAIASLPPAD